MIITIGGQKGGTGKSTIATNLAAWVAGRRRDVLLVEGNAAQGASSNWAERRQGDPSLACVHCIEKSGNLHQAVKDLAGRYQELVIDTGGQDSKEFRTALLASSLLVTPIRPSQPDIETLVYVAEVVDQAKEMNPSLKAWVLISSAPAHPAVKMVEETRDLLRSLEVFRVMDAVVHTRKVYSDAMPIGRGVCEMDNTKAAAEIEAVAKEIYSL